MIPNGWHRVIQDGCAYTLYKVYDGRIVYMIEECNVGNLSAAADWLSRLVAESLAWRESPYDVVRAFSELLGCDATHLLIQSPEN